MLNEAVGAKAPVGCHLTLRRNFKLDLFIVSIDIDRTKENDKIWRNEI
ncbi:MAG: hypothetical protein IKR73_08375 [Oscillospiraceae bacterium]|nr:hypothetical protein [Oscillospiraceae bacterium]